MDQRFPLKACHCCGLIHQISPFRRGEIATCTRCQSTIESHSNHHVSQSRTAAAAVAALVLFPAAILLPILEIDKLGHHHQSSIMSGITELYRHGSPWIATIILLFSVVLPLLKLLGLIELSWLCLLHKKHRAWTYRFMEHVGKWSMMDVMLLAFLVMMVKLSGLVQFHFGPAVIAFTLCVAMSMIATLCFDPHAIWKTP